MEARMANALTGQQVMRDFGMELVEYGHGTARVELNQLETRHLQKMGFVHGGVIATMADVVTGFAAFTLTPEDKRVVTAELSVQYFRPGIGQRMFALGKVEKPGQMLHFCEAEIYVVDGDETSTPTLIAKARAIMAVIVPPLTDPGPQPGS